MKRNEGVTLITLAIMIIIIIILSAITISAVLGDDGLLRQAQETKNSAEEMTEQYTNQMQGVLDEYTNRMAEDSEITVPRKWTYDEDGNVTNGEVTLKIGDYVDYDCTTSNSSYTSLEATNGYGDQTFTASNYRYGWRVLGANEETGELLILAEDFVPLTGGYTDSTANRTYFYLEGRAGVANGEEELNKICEIYGEGEGATGGRSIKVEDINKITGYNPNNTGVYDPEQTGSGTKYEEGSLNEYGNRVTYYWDGTNYPYYTATNGLTGKFSSSHNNSSYGNSFYWYDATLGWQSSPYTSSASTSNRQLITTLENTYYIYSPDTLTRSSSGTTVGIDTSSSAYKMLFTNSSTGAYSSSAGATSSFQYLLGSSMVNNNSFGIDFGLRFVINGSVNRYFLVPLDWQYV